VAFEGVQITGARIVGDVELGDAKLNRPIEIKYSRIEGVITLDHAHTDNLISLEGSYPPSISVTLPSPPSLRPFISSAMASRSL
jgi:hypothetical protein